MLRRFIIAPSLIVNFISKELIKLVVAIKQYKSYQTGIAIKQAGPIKRLFKLVIGLIVLAVLALFTTLLVFRWVPVPTSAFIYNQNSQAKKTPEIHEPAAYQWANWNEISPHLALAVMAAEDQRFPTHWGVDTIELKIVLSEKRNGKSITRGASTITQQLAKNLFLWNDRSYSRKILEAGLALAIEIAWPKKRILEVYLNVAQFGDAIFGAKESSKILFDKKPIDLTKEEAAMLAAVLPRPAISDVNDPRPQTKRKQKWILKQMRQLGGLQYLKKL